MKDLSGRRLTDVDLINLYVETPEAPARVGALALLDGRGLADADGRLRLAAVRTAIGDRLGSVPRLRQVIRRAGPFGGRPVWVDDPAFRLERHVRQVALSPGEEPTDLALRLVNGPLDRAHPLWRMWFVTGLPGGGVALVFGMHHVVADGVATVHMLGSLMDAAPPVDDRATARPPRARLPRRMRRAPRTSLNRPVGAHRRLTAVTMELDAARAVARDHQAKVNDVVLAIAAGGVRALLHSRAEPVDGVRVHVSVAVSLRPPGSGSAGGNHTGGIVVRVPLDADPRERLRAIALQSTEAKAVQLPTAGNTLLVWLARLGLLRSFSRHQRTVNLVESNVAGPPAPISLLGAPVRAVVPIGTLVGNLSLGFLALSYAGRLTIAVQADADQYPDLDVLIAAMERDRAALLA